MAKYNRNKFTFPGMHKQKHYYMYVLRLQNSFLYVGITDNPDRRLQEHISGQGSKVTQLYPPLERIDLRYIGFCTYGEAEYWEDYMTLTLMLQHGYQNVRGGHYVRVANRHIEDMLRNGQVKLYQKFGIDVRYTGIPLTKVG